MPLLIWRAASARHLDDGGGATPPRGAHLRPTAERERLKAHARRSKTGRPRPGRAKRWTSLAVRRAVAARRAPRRRRRACRPRRGRSRPTTAEPDRDGREAVASRRASGPRAGHNTPSKASGRHPPRGRGRAAPRLPRRVSGTACSKHVRELGPLTSHRVEDLSVLAPWRPSPAVSARQRRTSAPRLAAAPPRKSRSARAASAAARSTPPSQRRTPRPASIGRLADDAGARGGSGNGRVWAMGPGLLPHAIACSK